MRTLSKWLVRGLVCSTTESAVRNLENSENSHVEGSLHLQWHCNMLLKIHLNLLSGLMYTTSLSVDDCEHYLTASSVAHRRCCTELNFVTLQLKKACLFYYVVIKQAFQYKTKGIYLKMWPKERDSFVSK